jgi:hypothetical protein
MKSWKCGHGNHVHLTAHHPVSKLDSTCANHPSPEIVMSGIARGGGAVRACGKPAESFET